MYFNDIHILVYLLVGLIGLGVGFFVDWCNHRLPEYKKILSKEIISEYKTRLKPNYIIIAINGVAYIVLLAVFGIKSTFMQNLDLVKYLFLIPMLLSAFVIDYKIQIIPNRLTLTMFEVGLVITFLSAMANIYVAIDAVIGMIVGAGIFLLIGLIKEGGLKLVSPVESFFRK